MKKPCIAAGLCFYWRRKEESNLRPTNYKSMGYPGSTSLGVPEGVPGFATLLRRTLAAWRQRLLQYRAVFSAVNTRPQIGQVWLIRWFKAASAAALGLAVIPPPRPHALIHQGGIQGGIFSIAAADFLKEVGDTGGELIGGTGEFKPLRFAKL